MLAGLRQRIAMMLARGVVNMIDDSARIQLLQLGLLADEARDRVQRMQNYGLTSVPKPGAEAIVVCLGGTRDRIFAIAVDDRRYRKKNMEEGEVALYTDEGDYILLKRGRIIEVVAGNAINVTCPAVTLDGNLNVTGNITADGTVQGKTDVISGDGPTAVTGKGHEHPTAANGPPSPPTPGT